MHLSARFHWKWPPVLWYDLSLRKLIKEVYHDLKYNHFLNRALSYFSPLLSCVDDGILIRCLIRVGGPFLGLPKSVNLCRPSMHNYCCNLSL